MSSLKGWVVGAGLVGMAALGCGAPKRDFNGSGGGSAGEAGLATVGGTSGSGGAHSLGGRGDSGGANLAGDGNVSGVGGDGRGGDGRGGDGGGSGASVGGGGGNAENVCTPTQPVCNGNLATTCNGDGTGYLAGGLQCSSKQVCVSGACQDQECTPSASFCASNSVRNCAANGLSSALVATCATGQYCDAASPSCKTGICAPDQPACDGNRATVCTHIGDGYAAGGTTCKATETCEAGTCKAQVCAPNTSFCQGQDVKTCSSSGLSTSVTKTCTNQACVASAGSADCKGVCTPGQQDCSSNGVRTCDASGQYGSASKCTNKTCVVSGSAASCVGKCEPMQTQCAANSNSVATCGANGDFGAATPCAAATPYCTANTCQAPPSCTGLAANCGPSSNESCCTSPLVTGGPFKRDNDASFPATISDFRLDKYLVTVARFRPFVAAIVAGWRPAAGSGKHTHLNGGAGLKNTYGTGNEPGWDVTWNDPSYLPTTKASWDTSSNAFAYPSDYTTWTPSAGANETRPVNRVDWFKAGAFCIWDGGFLPSEAEWNYAAAGGGAQRLYPWGSAAPGSNATRAVYGCFFNGTGTCSGFANIAPVGSLAAANNGLYGQADLAGNLWEWVQDQNEAYTGTCNDCAYIPPFANASGINSRRGGAYNGVAVDIASNRRDSYPNFFANDEDGVRCARIP
ncbi:MAG TPA: SUMF1/EgtB/PvdO family nonheme iron enzyme [Polyangiaceae bacterium]